MSPGIVLFGDGQWAARSLQALVEAAFPVLAVIGRLQPSGAPLRDAASALRVPYLQPARVNSPESVSVLRQLAPQLALSISYDQILRKPLLDVPQTAFVNFHAGKLPFYRGRNVINWAIINGETELGLTAHHIDEGIDTGDIILQRTIPIGWTDTYAEVLAQAVAELPGLVLQTVRQLAAGTAPRSPQTGPGTYFGGREEGDEYLDWAGTTRNLYNKVRAISWPGPGARTFLGESLVRVWSAVYDPAWPAYLATPGQVVGRSSDGIYVKTGDSVLLVTRIQCGDGPVETPAWRIGTRLGIEPRRLLAAFLQMTQGSRQMQDEKERTRA